MGERNAAALGCNSWNQAVRIEECMLEGYPDLTVPTIGSNPACLIGCCASIELQNIFSEELTPRATILRAKIEETEALDDSRYHLNQT